MVGKSRSGRCPGAAIHDPASSPGALAGGGYRRGHRLPLGDLDRSHPGLEALAKVVRTYEQTLLLVDSVTGVCGAEVQTDAWGLDFVLTGSQKALALPPGLVIRCGLRGDDGPGRVDSAPRGLLRSGGTHAAAWRTADPGHTGDLVHVRLAGPVGANPRRGDGRALEAACRDAGPHHRLDSGKGGRRDRAVRPGRGTARRRSPPSHSPRAGGARRRLRR